MERKYPQAIAYSYDEILPSGTTLKFLLDDEDENHELPQGWEKYLVSDSQVRDYKMIHLHSLYCSFAA